MKQRNDDHLQFLADKVIATEVATSLMIHACLQLAPELPARFLAALDHVLAGDKVPTPGARAHLSALRAEIAANAPSAEARH